jgi:hypothetical protein
MKLIKHVAIAMTLTFTTAAFAEKSEDRRDYEKSYVKMCEADSNLAGTMVQARYKGYPLSKIMDAAPDDRVTQVTAMYVYQQPYMASATGRNLQEQQVKSMVLTECLRAM